jgi:hypothetical protein
VFEHLDQFEPACEQAVDPVGVADVSAYRLSAHQKVEFDL